LRFPFAPLPRELGDTLAVDHRADRVIDLSPQKLDRPRFFRRILGAPPSTARTTSPTVMVSAGRASM